ncbi:IPT/TIG domain-containing protein [Myxococcus sp. AM010]|uniref:IPT/TIG domain-containing protein n=1 Tax=Myxococcus sp. AM010 TaxID=2745138 RepID=UPI001595D5A5|nr:IPT/TIG domain-containing protein [Myxococcus sp. AM010]
MHAWPEGTSVPITITHLSVDRCSVDGGEEVLLTGTQIQAGATVTFGGTSATVVQVTPPTQIRVRTPKRERAGQVTVTATNPDGTSASWGTLFEYYAVVSKCSPDAGTIAGATQVTVTGRGFIAGMVVDFNGAAAAAVNIISNTELTCQTPANPVGAVHVDVWTSAARTAGGRCGNGFHYSGPATTGVSPREVPLAGGTDITLQGQYFGAGATVTIGGAPATHVVVQSETQITARTPARAAGAADVVVTIGAAPVGTLAGGLTYVGAALTAITPVLGPAAGGTVVTVQGQRFANGAVVTIGGVNALPTVWGDANTLTATAPALPAGEHDVVVQNPGEAAVTLRRRFKSIGAPVAAGVQPPRGGTAGGTAVTLTGDHFAAEVNVRIGGVAATNVVRVSASTLTATAPAHAAGMVDVEVQNAGGAWVTLANAFTYSDVSAVEPSRGPVAGGTALVIRGSGFDPAATVTLGGVPATGVVWRSANELAATTPAHVEGTVDLEVHNPGGALTLANGFAYSPITAIEPAVGPLAGGTVVVLRGGPFADGTTVEFGGLAAAALVRRSAQELAATTPVGAGVGPVDIAVRHNGAVNQVAGGFVYQGLAVVRAVEPRQGPLDGGTPITLTGDHFQEGATVTVEGQPATHVRVVSPNTITARTPLGPPPPMGGVRVASNVGVTNPGAAAVIGAGLYTYRDAARLISVAPARGPVGGRWVTLTGQNFTEGARVFLGGTDLTGVRFVDAQHLEVRLPGHAAGAVDLSVQNPDEPHRANLNNAFTYVTTPAETGDNEVVFILDGEAYFHELRLLLEQVRQAPPDPNTYVRLAFWMIEPSVTVGDATCFEQPPHRLLTYIEKIVRAGHDVDVIAWHAPKHERQFNGMADDVAKANESFAEAIRRIDTDAIATGPEVGRARMYLEHYEGDLVGAANHQKIAIVSIAGQRTALVGGLNLSNHYFAPHDHHGDQTWHDTAVRLRGPVTDDVEAEWMRRWRRTNDVATQWVWNAFGSGGDVVARNYAYWSSTTVKQQAVSIHENTTRQTRHPDNRSVSIALTRSVGSTRYRHIRDAVIERINAADDYLYFENYHFADPDLVQAVYRRHEARRLAGHELRVAIVVPMQGGSMAYMTRRAWLHMVLRFRRPDGTPYCRIVSYLDDTGTARQIDRTTCATWNVVDSFNTNSPTPGLRNRWLERDCIEFKPTLADPTTTVPLHKITAVDGDLHFYSCFNPAGAGNVYVHSKVAVFDDRWLVCGTANWSFRSMQYDGEIAAFVDSPHVAQGALTDLLNHYNPGYAVHPTTIEVAANYNLNHLATYGAHYGGAAYALLPLFHHLDPGLDMGRAMPEVASDGPNFTWT